MEEALLFRGGKLADGKEYVLTFCNNTKVHVKITNSNQAMNAWLEDFRKPSIVSVSAEWTGNNIRTIQLYKEKDVEQLDEETTLKKLGKCIIYHIKEGTQISSELCNYLTQPQQQAVLGVWDLERIANAIGVNHINGIDLHANQSFRAAVRAALEIRFSYPEIPMLDWITDPLPGYLVKIATVRGLLTWRLAIAAGM